MKSIAVQHIAGHFVAQN